MSGNNQTRKILLLSANPRGTSLLRLDEEMREIEEGLKRAKKRDEYSISVAKAVRYIVIHSSLLKFVNRSFLREHRLFKNPIPGTPLRGQRLKVKGQTYLTSCTILNTALE